VLKGPPVKLIHGLAHTKAGPTSVPTAPNLTPFHSIRVRTVHDNSFDHLVGDREKLIRHDEAEHLRCF